MNWGEEERAGGRAGGPLFVSTISFAEFSVSTQCLFLLVTSFIDPTFFGILIRLRSFAVLMSIPLFSDHALIFSRAFHLRTIPTI